MAYNYFPATYSPYGGMYAPQPQMPQIATPAQVQQQQAAMYQQQQAAQQMAQAPVQSSGIISVRSLNEVYAWPIAPGNSLTFYVETTPPVIATKTKGLSQLENPVVEEFDLARRRRSNPQQEEPTTTPTVEYATKTEVDKLRRDFEQFKTGSKLSFDNAKENISTEARDE
jgi:hypothetical protein